MPRQGYARCKVQVLEVGEDIGQGLEVLRALDERRPLPDRRVPIVFNGIMQGLKALNECQELPVEAMNIGLNLSDAGEDLSFKGDLRAEQLKFMKSNLLRLDRMLRDHYAGRRLR